MSRLVRSCWFALSLGLGAAGVDVAAQGVAAPGVLRDRFPPGSIDSETRAEAALAETAGAKARIEHAYRVEATECAKRVLVNACLDDARLLQRRRLADVDAVELEANRFKRKDRADRMDAERARRDAEREANRPADDASRARSRAAFAERQAQAAREAADRARSDASRTAKSRSAATGSPGARAVPRGPAPAHEVSAETRARNADDHAKKLVEAEAHRKDIERRVAAKTADRARRDADKAAKDARDAAKAQALAAKVPLVVPPPAR